ncbi:MAG: 4Fe-4S dicluster domain-containing protein [Ichthyobacteriaceae bacterium]|nr:4Fe-4S dicluster domain-containing protein [Ichthyobacteriaceae bacterium]
MYYLPNIFFIIIMVFGFSLFAKNIKKLIRNVKLGRDIDRDDNVSERWRNVLTVALGQSKMTKNPIAGVLHIIVFAGFIIINFELLEIIIDGVFGTHRIFSFAGGLYSFLINFFEILAFLVIVSVVVFWIRRNILRISRFHNPEMKGWAFKDANNILYIETLLMSAFLIMNAADFNLQQLGAEHYTLTGSFAISKFIAPMFSGMSETSLMVIERGAWWFHIIGILFFMNYLYWSKHLHILFAFPNVFYSKLQPKGELDNLESVTNEVKLMMDPNADPFAVDAGGEEEMGKLGASDVLDLNWVQIMNSYTCTECGRCTDVCPANETGKLLSPRNIMMKTRDRIEEIGKIVDKKGKFEDDGKTLLNDYITPEELWACTTCNACTEACPVQNDPLSIIVDLRRFLVLEQSAAPTELNMMMTNIENNGAPWQYSIADRLNWKDEDTKA